MQANREELVSATQQGHWWKVNQYLQQLNANAGIDLEVALESSLQVLLYGDFRERWEVSTIIQRLGKIAIPRLIAIAEDEGLELEVRWFAVRMLGNFPEPEPILFLVDLMQKTEEEDLQSIAASALANMGKDAIVALSQLLKDEKSKLLAVKSLSQINSAAIEEPLMGVVKDKNPEIRAIAIASLGNFHRETSIPMFLEALNDTSAGVRKEAAIALGMRGKYQAKYNLVTKLQPLLYDLDLEVCRQSAIALGRIKDNRVVTILFAVLETATTPIPLKQEIIRVLGWYNCSQALTYLEKTLYIEKLESPPHQLCQEIIQVLGNQELPPLKCQSAQILINFLQSDYATVSSLIKQAIATSLGILGEISAIPILEQLAADPEPVVRLHAIAGLKKLNTKNQ